MCVSNVSMQKVTYITVSKVTFQTYRGGTIYFCNSTGLFRIVRALVLCTTSSEFKIVYLDNRLIQRMTVGSLLSFLVQCAGLFCVMSCLYYARNIIVPIPPNRDISKL